MNHAKMNQQTDASVRSKSVSTQPEFISFLPLRFALHK